MANTKLDDYIDSLKEWDIIDYYGHDYTLKNPTPHEVTLVPTWANTKEEEQEETMVVSWGDVADQILDNEIKNG